MQLLRRKMWSKVVESGKQAEASALKWSKRESGIEDPAKPDKPRFRATPNFNLLCRPRGGSNKDQGRKSKGPAMANKCFAAITQLASTKRDGSKSPRNS